MQAGSDQLLLNWAASADEDGDLDAYLVQVDDAAPIEVSGDQLSLTLTDLTPATVVDLRLATRDTHGNISAGLRTAAGTLPADGIITQPTSYWSMDSTATAGSTVQDVVGLNHATTAAAYFNQVGRVEKAIRFNTSSHHVEIPNDPSLDASDGLTLSLWFNATAIIDNGALLVHGTAAEEAYGLTLQQADGQYPVFRFGAPAAPVRIGAVPRSRSGAVLGTLATNTWHHLAARFDAGLVTLWLDGNRIVSEQTGVAELPLVTDAVLTLGRYLPGAGERLVGYLDEVAYWNQALDEAEILETYQRGVRGLGLVTPTSKQDPERVRPSYEDQGRLVLIDEDREQPDLVTDKALWLFHTTLVIEGAVHAREIHLREGSRLILREQDGLIWADNLLRVDDTSAIEINTPGLQADEAANKAAPTRLTLRTHELILEGRLEAEGVEVIHRVDVGDHAAKTEEADQ